MLIRTSYSNHLFYARYCVSASFFNLGVYMQHIMPPYGTTPHPYVAVYPHGGIYAHPSIPPVILGNLLLPELLKSWP